MPDCAERSLRRDVNLTDKTAFARLAVRIGAGLPYFGSFEDLHAIVAAIADVEQAVVG